MINNAPTGRAIFNVSFEYTDDKGTYTHTINIANVLANMRHGDKKLNKVLRDSYKKSPHDFYEFEWVVTKQAIANVYARKWHYLITMSETAWNPFFNVDGVEETTTVHGKKVDSTEYGATENSTEYGATENSMEYGNTKNTTSYGLDKTTIKTGEQNGETHTKTNPYNDSDVSYEKDSTTNKVNERTDETTRNSHTDELTSDRHTDKATGKAHTDKATGKAHTDTNTQETYTDVVTYTRAGNIGITKTTELIESAINLDFNVVYIILDDIIENITRGY